MGREACKRWSSERAACWVRTEWAAGPTAVAGGEHCASFSLPRRARCFRSVSGQDPGPLQPQEGA